MSEQPTVGIVVPAYNARDTLERCLEHCLDQSAPAESVVVVDDGSTDDTAAVARRFPVTVLRQPNRGPAAARNLGARHAGADIVAFTDADCFPERDWLARLTAAFEPGVAAAGGTYGIANPEHLLARIVHQEIVERHRRLPREVDFLGSFNVAYRVDAFEAAHGFDEDFRSASGEDNDLAYRLKDAGGALRFVPEARVAHVHPCALVPYLRTQARHGFWRMKLYAKHPRRAAGDRYAGLADLCGAPLALLVIAAAPAALLSRMVFGPAAASAAAAGVAALPGVYAATHLPMAARTALHGREMKFLPCQLALAFLRDIARGLGMLCGFAHFVLLRGRSA
jgi:hypothetical protein